MEGFPPKYDIVRIQTVGSDEGIGILGHWVAQPCDMHLAVDFFNGRDDDAWFILKSGFQAGPFPVVIEPKHGPHNNQSHDHGENYPTDRGAFFCLLLKLGLEAIFKNITGIAEWGGIA